MANNPIPKHNDDFYIDLLDIDDFVKRYMLKEVTSSMLFSKSSSEPNVNGPLSYEIFGIPGTPERKQIYAYVNLNAHFIHPKVYRDLTAYKREIFKDIINGVGQFTVKNGELKRVITSDNTSLSQGKDVGTGIEFLYSVWDKLDFKPKPNQAQSTKEICELLSSLKKEEIFITKWLLMPAFYRDVDLKTNKKNEFNSFYSRLVERASMLKASSMVFQLFSSTDTHRAIQNTLNEIYQLLIVERLGGTRGFIQSNIVGKNTEYSARMVISAADFNYDSPEDAETSFTHAAIPLFTVIKIFLPFISFGLKQFFQSVIGSSQFIYHLDPKTKEVVRYEIDPSFDNITTIKSLQDRVDMFERSLHHRIAPVLVNTVNKKVVPLLYINNNQILNSAQVYGENNGVVDHLKDKNVLRPLNWSELFYIVAQNTVADKMVNITRYPIEDHNSIFPSFFNIIPCKNYKKTLFNGKIYQRFPDFSSIDETLLKDPISGWKSIPLSKLSTFFPDTLRMFPAFLEQLTAETLRNLPFSSDTNRITA